MAKTRRKKMNTSPRTPYGQQCKPAFLEAGIRVKVKGHRTAPGTKMQPDKDAKPVYVGRVYTGHNKGKDYPYAGAKRGGRVGS